MNIGRLLVSGLKQYSKFMKKDAVAATFKSYAYCKVASKYGMDIPTVFMYKDAVGSAIKYNLQLIKYCVKNQKGGKYGTNIG